MEQRPLVLLVGRAVGKDHVEDEIRVAVLTVESRIAAQDEGERRS